MFAFIALIGAIGWVVSYFFLDNQSYALIIVGIALVYALIQYFAAGKLAVAMTGAQEIEKADSPRLYRVVENLAITIGIPTPKIYIIDDPAPNAFATGRNPKTAIVGVTTGLLDIMDDRELTAVMAHEMGHVQNYDIRVSTITFGLVSAIGLISDVVLRMMFFSNDRNNNQNPILLVAGIIAIILAPIIAAIVQMAVSRQREYLADATGALTTRDPEGLASALGKLQQNGRPMRRQTTSAANLFLSNPLKPGFFAKLFSTHPPLEDRIARLRKNEGTF
jgi:heat shock protein HtpX